MLISQDEKQQAANLMTFYLYDKMHRLVVKGECEIPLNFAGAEQATICTYTGPGTGIDGCGYTANFNFPSPVLQLVNFYDDYSFRTGTGFNNTNFPAPVGNYSCGRKTGSIVYVPGQDTRLYKAYYYSMRGNLIREVSSNLRGGYDTTETTYSFTDRPSHSTHTHTAQNAPTLTEAYDYTYDHADRLTKVEHTFGGVKQTLLAHTYDELCRLSHTDYHGSSANRLNYDYNLRGWLTAISGSKFSQSLYYNTGNGTPCYNGNISSMTWKAGNETTLRGYKFTYDGLNRMLDAVYGESTSLTTNANRFTEKVTGYDKNGNILALQRYGQTGASSYGLIDNLTFTLDGNQLNRVDDAVTASAYNNGFEFKDAVKQANEYAYDANGNLTKDLNKNISNIQYNCLNLPSKVTFTDGSTIEYTYAADGTKLRTKHVINGTTTTTDYCGNVIYENGVQKLLLTEAGYLTLADSKYHYYLQDHQGNNRVVIDQNGTVEEVNHYYPFGGVFANSTSVQPYKYNGKELDTKKGLNWYDYGARHYDAAIGRFATVDPMAEKLYGWAPYAYCYDNPIKHVDKDGEFPLLSNIIGGGLGALFEYGTQVTTNILSGGFRMDAFTDVDFADIGIAAAEGFLTSGGSIVKSAVTKTAITIGATIAQSSIDLEPSSTGLKTTVNSASEIVGKTVVGLIGGQMKTNAKVNIMESKSSNKVINQMRQELHDKGEKLQTSKAKQIQAQNRARNEMVKKVNATISDKVNGIMGNTASATIQNSIEELQKKKK